MSTPDSMAFSIQGQNTGMGTKSVGSIVGTDCSLDWISIPCATNTLSSTAQTGTPATCVDRICGMVFNSVTAAVGSATASPVNSKYHSCNSRHHDPTLSIYWAQWPNDEMTKYLIVNRYIIIFRKIFHVWEYF